MTTEELKEDKPTKRPSILTLFVDTAEEGSEEAKLSVVSTGAGVPELVALAAKKGPGKYVVANVRRSFEVKIEPTTIVV